MIGRINENCLFDTVNFKQKKFDDGYECIEYSKPIKIRKKGYEKVNDKTELGKLKNTNLELDKEKDTKEKFIQGSSISRTKRLIIDYTRANKSDWHSFITLTFAENINDLTLANKKFNIFISSVKRVFPDLKYLCVPEFQKRGAVHYHLLTNLVPGDLLCPLQEGKKNMYNVKYWNHGYSSVFDIDATDKNFSIDKYITKYLTKDFERSLLFGRRKILCSNNLKKPEIDYSYLDDNQIKERIQSCSVNASEVKEKTVSCANEFCPSLKVTNIVLNNNLKVKL